MNVFFYKKLTNPLKQCEPPFVAETQAKIGCIAGDQIGQKTDTYVATEFSLPQANNNQKL